MDTRAFTCARIRITHTYIHTHTHTYARSRTYTKTHTETRFHRFHRVSSFAISRLSPIHRTVGPASSLCLLVPPSLATVLPSLSHLGGEHSLANLPYTFVCLNWVAFYTRAWSVNRILNYYSDCVLPGAPISPGSPRVHPLPSPLPPPLPIALISRTIPREFSRECPRRRRTTLEKPSLVPRLIPS